MSKLLISEPPLVFQPTLAVVIGLNEAIILQQINYWIEIEKNSNKSDVAKKHFRHGRWWIYNTYDQWQDQFPYLSISTIKRSITRLEKIGLLISDKLNSKGYDQTKWYTIDYEVLETIENTECAKLVYSRSLGWDKIGDQEEPTNTRDYHKELNRNFLKGDKGFLRQAKKTTRILEKNIRSVCLNEELDTDLCTEVILYYMRMYYDYIGCRHPFLNKDNLTTICRKICYGTDVVEDLDAEGWECLIDQHFNTDYGIEQDWNINFFLCDDVINNRFYEVLY